MSLYWTVEIQGGNRENFNGKKKKAVTAVQLTKEGKVKRMYAMRIENFSAQSLQYIFINQISREAKVITDKWRSYIPISKTYNITQTESNKGLNLKANHTIIHQIKNCIKTTYSWVSHRNQNSYFNEFCIRINRSQNKNTIFNNLITKMVVMDKINQTELISN